MGKKEKIKSTKNEEKPSNINFYKKYPDVKPIVIIENYEKSTNKETEEIKEEKSNINENKIPRRPTKGGLKLPSLLKRIRNANNAR